MFTELQAVVCVFIPPLRSNVLVYTNLTDYVFVYKASSGLVFVHTTLTWFPPYVNSVTWSCTGLQRSTWSCLFTHNPHVVSNICKQRHVVFYWFTKTHVVLLLPPPRTLQAYPLLPTPCDGSGESYLISTELWRRHHQMPIWPSS